MDVASLKKLTTLGLLAVFLLPAASLGADGGTPLAAPGGEFDLQLEDALSELGDEFSVLELGEAVVPVNGDLPEPVQVATLSTAAVHEMWASAQTVSEQSSTGASSGKKRWWKKKKWWIAVVAAVVAGAAVSGGDGDDNDDDSED